MFLPSRNDADPVKGESTLRRLLPFLLPRRSDAIIYFEQNIDVTKVLHYLEERKRRGAQPEITFFQVLLSSMLRAAYHWPKMNRYVAGKRIYQRKKIGLSFAVKKMMREDASMTVVKKEFEGHETLFEVAKCVSEGISIGRGKKLTKAEKEMKLIDFVPGFLVSFFIWLQRRLDGYNLLPGSLTRDDPLYTSIFVANLGSFGLDAPFHHLFEHGTAPIFAAIGNVQKKPMVDENNQVVARDVVCIRYSFDERITDGFYCAQALGEFAQTLQTPELLESPSERKVAQSALDLLPQMGAIAGRTLQG
jgi:pyruvate/2-oxoglutarate dehydrogenase complex dihydrolipoamide acyltransferase (E2) component